MTNIPLELDYTLLKEQGIAYIQQLGGKKWTDYGDHDPGITVLEVLAFAIMDLEYRTNFYIEDIWAKEANAHIQENPFYRAEEILPCNPLTKWDLLKIVLDVPGIKNANVLFSDGQKEIKGGYKIFVELEERVHHTVEEQEVLATVRERLYAQRNLCEDFFLIQTMQPLPVSIKATFELHNCLAYEVGEAMVSNILLDFQEFLSPRITFYSISQLLDKGRTIDQIFTGPILTQGFIDEEELKRLKQRSRIYTVDFLEKITKIDGIKGVLNFELFMDEGHTQTSSVAIPIFPKRSFVLNIPKSEIVLSYNGIPVQIDWEKVINLLEDRKGRGTLTKAYLQEEEVFVLEGNDRHLADYVSVQQDFPLLYNVGHEGCYPSDTDENKASAHQLKGFLLCFDQLFANYLSQLSNIKHRMAIYSAYWHKPDGQLPMDVPHMQSVLKRPTDRAHPGDDLEFVIQAKYLDVEQHVLRDTERHRDKTSGLDQQYVAYINAILESNRRSLDKRSKMLDHLLAYFAERFMTYSLDLYPKSEEEQLDNLNLRKALFLKDYIDISKNRSRAAHITSIDASIHYLPSGFKRRLYRNLGIKGLALSFFYKVIKQNMYLEKTASPSSFDVFLGKYVQTDYADFFTFKGKYENIQSLVLAYGINEANYHIITYQETYVILLYVDKNKQETVELVMGDGTITSIEQAEKIVKQSVALFRALNERCEGFHLIEHILLRSSDTLDTEDDPYSFTMTLVFPAWPVRFQQASFRHYVEEMVIMDTPAHLLVHILWLDFEAMETFEKAYESWLNVKTDPKASKTTIDATAKKLMDLILSYNNDQATCVYA